MLSFKIDLFFLISHEYIMRSVLANASSDARHPFSHRPSSCHQVPIVASGLLLLFVFVCLLCFTLWPTGSSQGHCVAWVRSYLLEYEKLISGYSTGDNDFFLIAFGSRYSSAGQGKALLAPPLSVTKCLRAQSGEDPVRQSQLSTETAFHGPPLYSPALALFQEGNFMGVSFKAEYPTITCSQNAGQP